MQFPTAHETRALQTAGLLPQGGDLLAHELLQAPAAAREAFVKQFVAASGEARELLAHEWLRKAVYHVVFREKCMQNVDVETAFNIVAVFGPKNVAQCVQFLESCNRSVLAKMGNLLLTKAELGFAMESAELESCLVVLFSASNIAEHVLTPAFLDKVQAANLKTWDAELLLRLARIYAPSGPVSLVRLVFPDLLPTICHALLAATNFDVETLTARLLDEPVAHILDAAEPGTLAAEPVLSEAERAQQELENKRKYWMEDPEEVFDDVARGKEQSAADARLEQAEQLLWASYHADPASFDKKGRGSAQRAALKKQLAQWTDEQIEGWARVVGSKSAGTVQNYVSRAAPAAKSTNSTKSKNAGKPPAADAAKAPKKPNQKRERERNQKRREAKIGEARKKKENKQAPPV